MQEIIKSTAAFGYSGYSVSNTGNIYSNKTNKRLVPSLDRYGYLHVIFSNNGRRKGVTVHRLVALAFIPNPENKPQVNHIDGNKLNNNATNLEWCTGLENIRHAFKIGLRDKQFSINSNIAAEICMRLERGEGCTHIANDLGISVYIVDSIKHKRKWKAISVNYKIPSSRNGYLTYDRVHDICKCIENGMSNTNIARRYSIGDATVSDIRHKRYYKTISAMYNFDKKFNNPADIDNTVVHQICNDLVKYRCDPHMLYEISLHCHVDPCIVQSVACKSSHTDISKQYPELWKNLMVNNESIEKSS